MSRKSSAKSRQAIETITSVPETAPVASSSGVVATQATLKAVFAQLAKVADHKSAMPMLGHACVVIGEKSTTLAATDLNVSLVFEIPWGGRPESFTIPAKAAADVIGKLPAVDLTLGRANGSFASITSAGGANAKLEVMSARDFPKIPTPKDDAQWTTLPAPTFASILKRVAFSVCKDETRFHLNGIFLESDGETLKATTTDGHRLTKLECQIAGPVLSKGVIIPEKGAADIVRLLTMRYLDAETCQVLVQGPHMFVRVGQATIAVKLIDAQFPAYAQVIPAMTGKLATVDRKSLLAALERAKTMCSDTRGVKVTVGNGKLRVVAEHPERGSMDESLPACGAFAESDKSFSVGFNQRYMADLVKSIDDANVTISMSAELDPILVRGTEDACSYPPHSAPFLGVVMPMRI